MDDAVDVRVDVKDGLVRVAATGILDLTNTDVLREALVSAADEADAVRLDLSGALFIDTAVVQHMATSAKKLLARGKRLEVLVAAGSHPERVIEVVGFRALMDVDVISASAPPQ